MEIRVADGRMEAINRLIQLANPLARGFHNFRAMAHLKADNLQFYLPTLLTH